MLNEDIDNRLRKLLSLTKDGATRFQQSTIFNSVFQTLARGTSEIEIIDRLLALIEEQNEEIVQLKMKEYLHSPTVEFNVNGKQITFKRKFDDQSRRLLENTFHGRFVKLGQASDKLLEAIREVWNQIFSPKKQRVEIKDDYTLTGENKRLLWALKNLVDATEDKNGQFSGWHKHLRQMTKEAKSEISKSEA